MAAMVVLLLGKPPERSPVLPEVIERLRAGGNDVRVDVPRSGIPLPGWLPQADVAALRGLSVQVLEAVAALESSGLRCCNGAAATLVTLDRAVMQRQLAAAGVPVPVVTVVDDASKARGWAAGRQVALKSLDASVGRGAGVTQWTDPAHDEPPPVPGPYLVQERVSGDGVDLVEGPHGPVVVDVNAFPSCNGVPGAAASIAGAVLSQAR